MKKVLVIDDDREMGRLLKTLFELEGYQVVVVSHYSDILPTIQAERPDVVLMDVHIQGERTMDTVRSIRREPDWANLPIIMTSGSDMRRECMSAGATLFVMKPFLPDELVHVVTNLLA
jgi:DNA-binding response OmpR family regulator